LPVTRVLAGHVAGAGVAENRIDVIPNGIDPAHFPVVLSGDAVRARYGLGTRIVIGFTGFMRAWHGVPAVIDVMAELQATHDVHFLLVGDGEDREGLLRAAREKGVDGRITITGIVPRGQIPAHVAAFDIAMQPKATPYASPLKLFEYMALGRAILAPNQPNLREVLRHEDNALLFTTDDGEGMRAGLRRLVTDAALRTKLGAAARASIADGGYTWDSNARRVAAAMIALQKPAAPACAPAESRAAP
jgi:glycosyltransferase involved in cell wall biosynthesis